ncbi:pirin family protein [Bacteriovorax sp. BSW11_IV]|uniref:pirin family protein n=1 Tax=Bacteriovorax sp. BSW11_IV TaxID=1353529 RepID=UPI00038A50F0|nr:pirin family protein [Bacteriovorax sp. BSW11_IV]EQC48618.1 pirin family protein [Bacteriovorax sp. BSW11_IV]
MSNVELVIEPRESDLGDNFVVRRLLPYMKKRMVGPFIFWDHMGPVTLSGEKKMKVRAHPHIGLSTITYLFSGEIMHRDSLGNEQMIRPGEVNWMTAGSGIVHSERAQSDTAMNLEGIQLWVALPKESEDVEPSFVHVKESSLPLIEKGDTQLRLIAGESMGSSSPLPVYSKLFYFYGQTKEGEQFSLNLGNNEEGALYVVNGTVEIEGKSYERFSLIVFKKGHAISFQASSDAQYMLFGGETFPEKRYIWWNFVSSDKEKLERAKLRWKNNEFPKVINEVEQIPLPEE